jgi:hypothetical protein
MKEMVSVLETEHIISIIDDDSDDTGGGGGGGGGGSNDKVTYRARRHEDM